MLGPILFFAKLIGMFHILLPSFDDNTQIGISIKSVIDALEHKDFNPVDQWARQNNINNDKFDLIQYGLKILLHILCT